jgi:hypothetical protein
MRNNLRERVLSFGESRRLSSLSGKLVLLLGSLALLGLLVSCRSVGPLGEFRCADRTARATPPGRFPPTRADVEKKQRDETYKPLVETKLCPEGQVPVATPAKPTVAKGNPLIGPVEGRVERFFGSPKEEGERIRKSLRRPEDFYDHGPGIARERPPEADPPGCNGVSYYGSCYYYGSAAYSRQADGGGMTMTIEGPAYDGSGGPGHTLDEIAVQGGAGSGDIIELGWNVSTTQYKNANPHLFVFHWIGWNPTCYDACGWQQYSATYFPGMDLGTLVGRPVYIGYVFYEGNWWGWFDNQWLGYFPGSEWNQSYTQNNMIQWFGEVASANGIPPHTDMGNGLFPTSTGAARNATLCDVNARDWVCWYRDQQSWGATFPSYYNIDRTGFGETRYGGPGE